MNNPSQISFKRIALKVVLLALLAMPELAAADAQFNFNQYGDVLAGFRKTGAHAGNYELVADLGNVTNFLKLPIGTTITISNVSPTQLTNAFTDTGNFGYLQWSAFTSFPGTGRPLPPPWVTPLGSFPGNTLWVTIPATNISYQTTPPVRMGSGTAGNFKTTMISVGSTGAYYISSYLGADTNNTPFLVREPVSYSSYILTYYIGDSLDQTMGDFGSGGSFPLPFVVENTTPATFNSTQRDDFYQLCPLNTTDPLNGSTNETYFIGYFLLYPNGSMTFTRAAATAATPVASFTGGPTNGFSGFTAMFTNNSTGTITNYIWNFGDGTSVTNSSGANVSHVFATGGNFTVSLTVQGPGGVNVQTQSSFIMVYPLPIYIKESLVAGQLILSGTNCPPGAQYRILNATNFTLPMTWIPVATNNFMSDGTYTCTNPIVQKAGFFRLVSP